MNPQLGPKQYKLLRAMAGGELRTAAEMAEFTGDAHLHQSLDARRYLAVDDAVWPHRWRITQDGLDLLSIEAGMW